MLGNQSRGSGYSTPLNRNNYSLNDGKSYAHDYYYDSNYSKASNYLDTRPSNETSDTICGFPNSIGEYGMGRLLGRGAFGSVYEVTEIRHKTPLNDFKYAIKIMEKKSIKNEEMAKRVRNEVSLHKKMRHPNILTLFHFFEDDERVYLVMEVCARGELYTLLRTRRQDSEVGILTENEARTILRDVVAGLKFLHSRGIIHRDLKLSNILLSETGKAKIADFGLAVLTEGHPGTTDSRERTICGTPNYLAPEILNKKNYGRGADIWSLGCLLYSFLTGRPPFDSPDLPQTFDRVKRLDYKIPDNVSPAARDLITRLLSGDPGDRPTFDQIIWHPFFNPSVSNPLSTRRLSPLKQMTKYGSIEILGDGRVSIDFLGSPDVLIVSGDGLRVELIDKRTGVLDHMAIPTTNLPGPLKRRYEYARRFINLVKGKSPLIILSTFAFKAYLMENSVGTSTGDFYMNYRDGLRRLEYCWVSRQLRIFEGPSTCVTPSLILSDPSPQVLPDVRSPSHREILLEFLARYRQCLQIRDGMLHPDDGTERSKYRGIKFPIVIKEPGGGNDESSHLNFNLASVSNSFMVNKNQDSHQNLNLQNTNNYTNNNTNTSNSNNNSNSTNNNNNSNNNMMQRKYLHGIGWCLSTSSSTENNYFLVLFNDGRCIQIDGQADTVLDLQTNRLLPINAQLPENIKEMLALFSKFL